MAVTYTPIQTYTTSTNVSDITFSSIPSTYTDLVLVFNGTPVTTGTFMFQVNGDTGTNYSFTDLVGTGSLASSQRATSKTFGIVYDYTIGTPTTSLSSVIMNFMSYSNSTTYKTVLTRGWNANTQVETTVNLWRSTSAINSIKVYHNNGNIVSGATATLYGIKAA